MLADSAAPGNSWGKCAVWFEATLSMHIFRTHATFKPKVQIKKIVQILVPFFTLKTRWTV